MPMRTGWIMLYLTTTWMLHPHLRNGPPWGDLRPTPAQRPIALTQGHGELRRPEKPGEAFHLILPGLQRSPRDLSGPPGGFRF
ncbi:hypothetical protein [Mesoterricola silvestris]|uniref:Uncharacterized protein n=1 Tax=Mesoterricola silvestris TaxID=2927979 RepID=A0AA48KAQ1_9BACT|nr:hypothetical protein [Mesoterricola silvestris]BDU71723.1 hypothetical protein METEAL_08970 [Mesoterricola silvestris]